MKAEKEKEGILLESGTNEIEIMKFKIQGEFYGINVAKVKEIMMAAKVKVMPHAHPAVEGIFKPRDILITVIDLGFYLTNEYLEHKSRDLFIVTNFNKMTVAFRVQSIEGMVIAEDSILLQKMIDDALSRAGFTDVKNFNNGQEAWDYLKSISHDSDLYDKVNLVITDIEMPEMDGHRLTKLIKEDERLKQLPVVIFSSLIDEQMRIKGEALGADEQLTKPEIGNLVHVIDRLLDRFEKNIGKAEE